MPYTTIRLTDESQRLLDDEVNRLKRADRGWSASAIINSAIKQYVEQHRIIDADLHYYQSQVEEDANAACRTKRTK